MKLALLFLVLLPSLAPRGDQLPPLESILSAAERQELDRAVTFQETLKVHRRVLDRFARIVRAQLSSQNTEKIQESVLAIRSVVREAMQLTARVTDRKALRSRSARRMEIRLRKLAEELESQKRASPFELWEVFEAAVEDVTAFRNDLLDGFFAAPEPRSGSAGFTAGSLQTAGYLPLAAGRARQLRIKSSISGDQFTDAEFELLRDAQELKERVEVFLNIAEARLDEIERRTAGIEWDKEDPNPLEFYTYAQLTRAYQRSLEGIMINIDEKATRKTAPEKEIKKSLKMLNSRIQTFIPRLEPVKKLAEDRRDEDLHVEWREAWKSSQQALKGSQYGLGAPAQPKDP